MLIFSTRPGLVGACVVSTIMLALPGFARADITFADALETALTNAPVIKAGAAKITAAQQAAIPAAALPDPRLSLGINNLPIEGADRFDTSADPMTMRQIGVMQEIPNSAKRQARAAAARSDVNVAQYELVLDQLLVAKYTASAWLTRYNLERQEDVLGQWDDENQLLARIVSARQSTSSGGVIDSLLPRQEAALLEERRDLVRRDKAQAQAVLQRWLGDAANQPLSGEPPVWTASADLLITRLEQHPALAIYGPKARRLDAQLAEARADKRPDWAVELMLGQRDFPAEDMISLKFSVDLPLFTGSRQNPRIAAKRAERAQLDAEQEDQTRQLTAALTTDLADYEQLQRALHRQTTVLVPLAAEKVSLLSSAWRGNRATLIDVIEARREHLNAQLRQWELQGQRDLSAAHLYFTYGYASALRDPTTLGSTPLSTAISSSEFTFHE